MNPTQLPPRDRGRTAWLTLAACFCVEGVTWSLPFSYGVFQQYYETSAPFNTQRGSLPAVGSTTIGALYCLTPLLAFVIQRWPFSRKPIAICGLFFSVAGLVGASYAQNINTLIATQGVVFGIGLTSLYTPFLYYLDDWFDKRKGLAYGCLWAGTGAAGLAVPLIMGWGLDKFGFRAMLRGWAVTMVVVVLPFIILAKPRQTPEMSARLPLKRQLAFLQSTSFWILLLGDTLGGLGYFFPSIFLPSFASSVGVANTASFALNSVQNTALIIGSVMFGYIIDNVRLASVWLFNTLGTAIIVCVFWGLSSSHTKALVWVFTVLYGLFAGGATTLWTGVAKEMQAQHSYSSTSTAMILSVFGLGRGLGNVVSGPISDRLLAQGALPGASFAYGTRYGVLIVFTAISAFAGSIGWISKYTNRPPDPGSEAVLSHDCQATSGRASQTRDTVKSEEDGLPIISPVRMLGSGTESQA